MLNTLRNRMSLLLITGVLSAGCFSESESSLTGQAIVAGQEKSGKSIVDNYDCGQEYTKDQLAKFAHDKGKGTYRFFSTTGIKSEPNINPNFGKLFKSFKRNIKAEGVVFHSTRKDATRKRWCHFYVTANVTNTARLRVGKPKQSASQDQIVGLASCDNWAQDGTVGLEQALLNERFHLHGMNILKAYQNDKLSSQLAYLCLKWQREKNEQSNVYIENAGGPSGAISYARGAAQAGYSVGASALIEYRVARRKKTYPGSNSARELLWSEDPDWTPLTSNRAEAGDLLKVEWGSYARHAHTGGGRRLILDVRDQEDGVKATLYTNVLLSFGVSNELPFPFQVSPVQIAKVKRCRDIDAARLFSHLKDDLGASTTNPLPTLNDAPLCQELQGTCMSGDSQGKACLEGALSDEVGGRCSFNKENLCRMFWTTSLSGLSTRRSVCGFNVRTGRCINSIKQDYQATGGRHIEYTALPTSQSPGELDNLAVDYPEQFDHIRRRFAYTRTTLAMEADELAKDESKEEVLTVVRRQFYSGASKKKAGLSD